MSSERVMAGSGVPLMEPLNRYEITNIVGLRALALAEGARPCVDVTCDHLKMDLTYVAALELFEGKLDAIVLRKHVTLNTRHVECCDDLALMLDIKDGGSRRTHLRNDTTW